MKRHVVTIHVELSSEGDISDEDVKRLMNAATATLKKGWNLVNDGEKKLTIQLAEIWGPRSYDLSPRDIRWYRQQGWDI